MGNSNWGTLCQSQAIQSGRRKLIHSMSMVHERRSRARRLPVSFGSPASSPSTSTKQASSTSSPRLIRISGWHTMSTASSPRPSTKSRNRHCAQRRETRNITYQRWSRTRSGCQASNTVCKRTGVKYVCQLTVTTTSGRSRGRPSRLKWSTTSRGRPCQRRASIHSSTSSARTRRMEMAC